MSNRLLIVGLLICNADFLMSQIVQDDELDYPVHGTTRRSPFLLDLSPSIDPLANMGHYNDVVLGPTDEMVEVGRQGIKATDHPYPPEIGYRTRPRPAVTILLVVSLIVPTVVAIIVLIYHRQRKRAYHPRDEEAARGYMMQNLSIHKIRSMRLPPVETESGSNPTSNPSAV